MFPDFNNQPMKRVLYTNIAIILLYFIPISSISQAPGANFSSDIVVGCSPIVVSFSDLSTGSPTSWKWDLGNGTISTLKDPKTTYIEPGVYTVKLTATNASGNNTMVKTAYIRVYESPIAEFTADDTMGCVPVQTRFTDRSQGVSGNIVKWEWALGDGSESNLPNPQKLYENPGTYNVSLKVTNDKGCTGIAFKPQYIQTGGAVTADFTSTTLPYCKLPVSISFTNTSDGYGNLKHAWSFGDGQTSTSGTPTIKFNQFGSQKIVLISANEFGCKDTITKTIKLAPSVTDFSAPAAICAGSQAAFTLKTEPEPFAAYWYFSDGTTYADKNIEHTFEKAGTYTVKLVNDFGGCIDSVTKTVIVKEGASADFTATKQNSCAPPLTTSFSSNATGVTSYLWQFGDGKSSTAANPTYTYNTRGNYGVTLTITNNIGCVFKVTKEDFINVTVPQILFEQAQTGGCAPFAYTPKYTVKNVDPSSITSYKWSFGDGSTGDGARPTHSYKDSGTYNLRLSITTADGCSAEKVLLQGVKVGLPVAMDFTINPTTVCGSADVQFKPERVVNNLKYIWQFGDTASATTPVAVHNYLDTGYFDVMLQVDNNGCITETKKPGAVYVKVPIANFDYTSNCNSKQRVSFTNKSIEGKSITWYFGDGTTSTVQNPQHVYSATGDYKVMLVAVNGGCVDTMVKVVKVWLDGLDVKVTKQSICRNDTAFFDFVHPDVNLLSSIAIKFTETGTGGFTSTYRTSFYRKFAVSGSYGIYAIFIDTLGCRDTVVKSNFFRVNGPEANFGVDLSSKCINSNFIFTDSSKPDPVFPITNYTWDFGDSTIKSFTSGPFEHAYTKDGSYTISLAIKDANGCVDTLSKPYMVSAFYAKANFFSIDSFSCRGKQVRFADTSAGTVFTRLWDFGDGTTSTDANPTHTYTKNGKYNVSLRIKSGGNCSDSIFKSNYINIDMPKAAFALSDSVASCPPLQVKFTDKSHYVDTYTWDLADGGVTSVRNPVNNYFIPKNYRVKLLVTSPGGCTDSAFANLFVSGPYGEMFYTPTQGCAPVKTQLNVKTTGAVHFTWDFADGFTQSGKDSVVSYTYLSGGNYVPKVLIKNAEGCVVPIVGFDTIRVEKIDINFTASKTQSCDTATVFFTDSTLGTGDISYKWHFGDLTSGSRQVTSDERHPQYFYQQPGAYTVKLVTKSSVGCVDSLEYVNMIKVSSAPKPKIVMDSVLCEGLVTFSYNMGNDTIPITSRIWRFGNGSTSNSAVAKISFDPGNYTTVLSLTNRFGCSSVSEINTVVHPLPIIQVSNDTTICRGDAIKLTASGASRYSWTSAIAINGASSAAPTVKPTTDTWFKVVGRSAVGCADTDSVLVKVLQPYSVKAAPNQNICIGNTAQLYAEGAQLYMWYPSDGLSAVNIWNPEAKPQKTTTYNVMGYDTLGCFKDTLNVTVTVNTEFPVISLGSDITVPVGTPVGLLANANANIVSYKWVPATGLDCANCPSPNITPNYNAVYRCIVTNDKGCSAEDTLQIFVLCDGTSLFVPNTFTPNNDGANDVFYARGKGIDRVQSMKIFDRWGKPVFEIKDASPNNPVVGWDGTVNGRKAENGVYYYYMDVICNSGEIMKKQGDITLMR